MTIIDKATPEMAHHGTRRRPPAVSAAELDEAAAIAARRPDVVRADPDAAVLHNASTSLFEFPDGAQVTVEPSPRDGCAVLRLSYGRQTVVVDLPATVLHDIFRTLDDAVVVCDACERPAIRDDVTRCVSQSADVHVAEHRDFCSNWAECMGDYPAVGL